MAIPPTASLILPRNLPAASAVTAADMIVGDNGSVVQRITPPQIVDAAIPLASQSEAEAGTDNTKRMSPLRVAQAIAFQGVSAASLAADTGATLVGATGGITVQGEIDTFKQVDSLLRDDVDNAQADATSALTTANSAQTLASGALQTAYAASGDGMSAIGYQRDNDTDLVLGSGLLNSGPVYAVEFGVSAANSGAGNVTALGRAIDYIRDNGGQLVLPAGELIFDSDVAIDPFPTRNFLQMSGQGSGENGTFLHFTSGSLKVHCVHQFSDFRVTSDNSDGINILPGGSPVNYPARSSLRNIHAVYCAGDGIAISANWIYLMTDVYARYNKGWGIAGRGTGVSPFPTLACNALTIVGGEFQGNGTIQGTPVGANGGTLRGTGGGINTGQAVQVTVLGSSIEGNKGDGLKLGEGARGVSVIGSYFEKNGSHETNRDICNDQPSSSPNGPNSVYILNSQYTPQDYNGNVQERAIELWDVVDLRIVSPQFFTSGGNGFSLPPIYVRESTAGRCSGWVEGRYYTSIGAYPVLLTNETRRFGFPRVQQFSPDLVLPQAADTTSQTFYVDMPAHCGQQVDIDYDVRPMTGNSVGQEARIVTRISRGPTGAVFSTPANQAAVAASYPSVKQRVTTFRTDLPGTSVEIAMQRNGTNALDTALGPFRLMGVRVTTYAGVVTSLEKT